MAPYVWCSSSFCPPLPTHAVRRRVLTCDARSLVCVCAHPLLFHIVPPSSFFFCFPPPFSRSCRFCVCVCPLSCTPVLVSLQLINRREARLSCAVFSHKLALCAHRGSVLFPHRLRVGPRSATPIVLLSVFFFSGLRRQGCVESAAATCVPTHVYDFIGTRTVLPVLATTCSVCALLFSLCFPFLPSLLLLSSTLPCSTDWRFISSRRSFFQNSAPPPPRALPPLVVCVRAAAFPLP